MHSTIAGGLMVLAAACTGCADPMSPQLVEDPTVVASLSRARPTVPIAIPDSSRIPTPPFPPIIEEAPPELDGTP